MLIQNWSILFFSFSISSCWKRYPRAFLLDKKEDHPVKIYAICIQMDCLLITTGRWEFGKRQAILISQPGRKLFEQQESIWIMSRKCPTCEKTVYMGMLLIFCRSFEILGSVVLTSTRAFPEWYFTSVMWTTHDKSWRIPRCFWPSLMLLALNGKRSYEVFLLMGKK